MSWIDKTSFSDDVKKMSYSKLIKIFGEDKGEQVANKFGTKKEKKTSKKKED